MNDTVFTRRSIRRFKQIPVTDEQIHALLDSALVAPSARNGQILRYCVVSSPGKLQEVFNNTAWAGYVHPKRIPLRDVSSPMLFIVVSAIKTGPEISPHTWADAGAAIENMLLTAVELGLGGCWIGSFNREILEKTIAQPEDQTALYVVAFGVPDESPILERIDADGDTRYYLDDRDVLHVPKLTAEAAARYL